MVTDAMMEGFVRGGVSCVFHAEVIYGKPLCKTVFAGQPSASKDKSHWAQKQYKDSALMEAIIKQWVHEDTAK
jgi:hypothetical protein